MIEFKKLNESHLGQVLRWRTQEDVTRYMHTDIDDDMNKQKAWFEHLSLLTTDKYWVIAIKGHLIGLIYLTDIDWVNKRTSWGFYIGEEKYRIYGGIIPRYLYHYAFVELGLHKITAEVMKDNINVVKLNKMLGNREVGICKEHIYKNGTFHDVILFELLKDDWKQNDKYQAIFE